MFVAMAANGTATASAATMKELERMEILRFENRIRLI
jgi:hypothetical protein